MKFHDVQKIEFHGQTMVLVVDGREYSINLGAVSSRLASAADAARLQYSVAPSGYGIHWPAIDEDLTIDGLIAAARAPQLLDKNS